MVVSKKRISDTISALSFGSATASCCHPILRSPRSSLVSTDPNRGISTHTLAEPSEEICLIAEADEPPSTSTQATPFNFFKALESTGSATPAIDRSHGRNGCFFSDFAHEISWREQYGIDNQVRCRYSFPTRSASVVDLILWSHPVLKCVSGHRASFHDLLFNSERPAVRLNRRNLQVALDNRDNSILRVRV